MKKRIVSLLLIACLLGSLLPQLSSAAFAASQSDTGNDYGQTRHVGAEAFVQEEFEIVGEWIHATDVYSLGADVVADRCAKNGITDIYLLVKGTAGTLGYNKTRFTNAQARKDIDILQETIDAAHAKGVRVHAWLVGLNDALYKSSNPDAGLWHYIRGRDNEFISASDEGYRAYMTEIVKELATNYDIDGIQLDYIRYNHVCNGWSSQDFANLEAMGADIENVRYLINKTFYEDKLNGESADDQYIFNAYRNGDKDALLIGKYRCENIASFATVLRDAAKAINPDLVFSASVMPEGASTKAPNDYAFADLHYGQNYEDTAEVYDYICPMAYTAGYGEDAQWFATLALNAAEMGNSVVMGTQSWSPATSASLMSEIEAARALLPNEKILGIVHFRHTQFGYAKFTYNYADGDMDLDVINTNMSYGYKWIIVEAAEGVKLTGATYRKGFNSAAPVSISNNGRTMTLGYTSSSSKWLMSAGAEGTVNITFEGEPTDPNARIAYARIYITNESRAYSSYKRELNITFAESSGAVTKTQKLLLGESLSVPSAENVEQWSFLGWSDTKISETTVKPSYLNPGTAYFPTTDVTLYPVYSYTANSLTYYATTPRDIECEHTQTHEEVLQKPTCTQSGVTAIVCDSCGVTLGQKQTPAAHAYELTGETAPGCEQAGVKTYTCANCGATKTETVSATGHTAVPDAAVAPTCAATGLGEGSHCSVCGTVLKAQEIIPATGHTPEIIPGKPATCTASGISDGEKCTVCGEMLVAQSVIPRLGHEYKFTDNGDGTHCEKCIRCDKKTASGPHSFVDGECIACDARLASDPIYDDAQKFSHSLTLENDISINFIALGSALEGYESFYLECKVPVYSGNELTGYEIVNIEPVYNGKNYEFTLMGVTAKMMNDDIEAVLRMTKDGQEYYSKTDVYSVAEYAYGKLDSTKATDTDELKAICANLLRYGALAQTQFNYRTDALVDAAMSDAHKAYLTDLSTVEMVDYRKQLNDLATPAVPWKSTTLELGNKVIMCLIVNLSNYTGDPTELTMRLTYTDNYGAVITEERPLELYSEENKTYAVSYDGLRATEMRSIVSAAIYSGETRVSKTVEYSIESYGARSTDTAMRELCLAMLAYGDAANAFFSK